MIYLLLMIISYIQKMVWKKFFFIFLKRMVLIVFCIMICIGNFLVMIVGFVNCVLRIQIWMKMLNSSLGVMLEEIVDYQEDVDFCGVGVILIYNNV